MELSKPVEFARYTAGMAANAGRYALRQMQGGAWADLADTVVAPQPASITYYTTPEQLEIPTNIHLGAE